ncbi:MAG: trypsin-like peptidase domain-containing protein [Rhodothalassiaceae bacterium]
MRQPDLSRWRRSLAALMGMGALMATAVLPAGGQEGAAPAPHQGAVPCLDEARGIVQTKLPHLCQGRIISEAEAEQIQRDAAQARAQRLNRINRATAPPRPSAPRGTRFGSAFALGAAGHFMTAYHVVAGCRTLELRTSQGEGVAARLAAAAPGMDAAVLRADLSLAPAPIFSGPVRRGLAVQAVGYPEEGLPRILPRIRDGVLAGRGPLGEIGEVYALRVSVRGGNSGGPLFTPDGRLLGMVIAKADRAARFRVTGDLGEEIGYAIPIQRLMAFAEAEGLLADAPAEPGPAEAVRVVCDGS